MRLLPSGGVARRHTTARLDAWLRDPAGAAHDDEELMPEHALREAAAFGLRDLLAGVDLPRLAARHRVSGSPDVLRDLERALDRAVADGDVERHGDVVRLTSRGARFADRVARALLAPT
jgi:coproporphyrinogen III oxidase-like Fe-S oxidoreductase